MNTTLEKPRVDKITVKVLVDNDADCSFLEQEGFEDRLEAFRQDRFYFVGVMAEAEVSYPIDQECRRLERFTSGGLWGIESDSTEYIEKEVSKEQLDDLKDHLEHFGVNVSDFGDKAQGVEIVWV